MDDRAQRERIIEEYKALNRPINSRFVSFRLTKEDVDKLMLVLDDFIRVKNND